jgi:glycosyltransferase involved in cell wall biosynthesis
MKVAVIDLGKSASFFSREVARGLAAEERNRVTLIRTATQLNASEVAGVSQVVLGRALNPGDGRIKALWQSLKVLAELARFMNRTELEAVVDTGLSAWTCLLPRFVYRKAVTAYIVHDATPHPGLRDSLLSQISMRKWKQVDSCVTLSRFCAEALRRRVNVPLVESRLGAVNQNTVAIADFDDHFRRNAKHFVCFGRMEQYKGISLLLDAFDDLKSHDPEVHLKILGSRLSPAVERRAIALGVDVQSGWFSDDQLSDAFSTSGSVVLPYLSATQSAVAATALANGLPVVVTDVGAMREQVDHERTGLVVPPLDAKAFSAAMLRLAGDPLLATRLSAEALARSRSTDSWSAIGPAMLEAIVRNGRRRPRQLRDLLRFGGKGSLHTR